MFAMACVAFGCFALFVLHPLSLSLLLSCCFLVGSAAVLSLLVYGVGDRRAFAVGCFLPLSLYWISLAQQGGMVPQAINVPRLLITTGFVTVASGFVSVGVRRYCVSKQDVDHSTTDA